MKPTRVAVLAALGMLLTSVSVYSLTPPGGVKITADDAPGNLVAGADSTGPAPDTTVARSPSEFQAGNTLHVEGRLGHTQLAKSSRGETFVMLEVKADPGKAKVRAPVNLALAIDRSGSMKGNRLRNAIQGALVAVDRLNEGDTISVVTFDSRSSRARPAHHHRRLVPRPRPLRHPGHHPRRRHLHLLRRRGRAHPARPHDRPHQPHDRPLRRRRDRGRARHPRLPLHGQRARDRGTSITTIGVDVDYNEKILTAIAADSNGRHYFVENDSALERAFEAEAETLTGTIASATEAQIELAPGVELVRVFDRTFRRVGNRVVVPLGSFSGSETKTILVKVRAPVDREGLQAVADVDLTYRDHVADTDGRCSGKLALDVTSGTTSTLDSLVEGRVNRSETSTTLREANDLFSQGRFADAKRKLEERQRAIVTASAEANTKAPLARKNDVDRDFQSQASALADANQQFASPPASIAASASPGGFAAPATPSPAPQQSRQGKAAVKQNASRAMDMGF